MRRMIFLFFSLVALLCGCSEEHVAERHQYVHFMLPDGTSQAVVLTDVDALTTYYVYLVSAPLSEAMTVEYAVEAGAGLTEGVDYEVLGEEHRLTFLPGVYEMPIRVRWMPHTVSPTADNRLTLRLTRCSDAGFALGMPGPDGVCGTLVFNKRNPN